ncbi:MAG: recombinase family protein, partial [Anaerolineales bacterium]|nr:recombinase family protein [Anaerolineales bacterium]
MSDYIYPPPSTLPPGSEVIAYMRDSGGANQSESIGQQERVILDYCKSNGLVLTCVYSETASGRRTKNREQFLEMCDYVMTCPDDLRPRGLLLWAYSRFSRDIVDFNYYLYGLLKKGLIVHSLTESIPEGLTGQILLSLKAYNNADFSIQLGKQIKRGIADRVKSGYNNGGQAPKGYRVVREYQEAKRTNGMPRIGVKWEPDPILAPLVKLAWEMRAQGASYSDITKATEGRLYTSINSWVTHFRNESYIGIGKAGELRIEDHHEPLIPWELWQAVREMEKETKKRFGHKRIKFPTLLAGLAYCVHCGAAMVVHTSDGYRCYICGKRDRKHGFADCPNSHRVNAPRAEARILDTIFNRILTPDFARVIVEDVQNQLADTAKIDREIGQVTDALIAVERSIARLVKLAEDTGEIQEVKNRLIELKRQQAEYSARIRELKTTQEIQTPQVTPEALELIFDTWRAQVKNAKERGDIATARKLLTQFVQKIELGNKKAIIHYTYPMNAAIPANNDASLCAHHQTIASALNQSCVCSAGCGSAGWDFGSSSLPTFAFYFLRFATKTIPKKAGRRKALPHKGLE